MPAWRFSPYGTLPARPNEYRNAEAGPSTLVPPPAPYLALPTINPSGGISEAAADAANNRTDTEEDVAPVSNFYCSHIPRVTERLFGVRQPGDPEGRDKYVTGASGLSETPARCVPGHKGGRIFPNFRAIEGL